MKAKNESLEGPAAMVGALEHIQKLNAICPPPGVPIRFSERQALLPPALRELHRAVLREFLSSGDAPSVAWFRERARRLDLDPDGAAARLAASDLVHLEGGLVAVAYPFSGTPTPHRVQLTGGPGLTAMCAVDALGIPQMARRDGVITSVDRLTGERVWVGVMRGSWHWDPADAVLVMGSTGRCGPAAKEVCEHVGFHTHADHARRHSAGRPELKAEIFEQRAAIEIAGLLFSDLLNDAEEAR